MSRPNLPPKQPAEHQIELGGEISLACVRCPGIGTDDKQATRWEPSSAHPGHLTKPSPDTISDHRPADRTGNDKSDPGGGGWIGPSRFAGRFFGGFAQGFVTGGFVAGFFGRCTGWDQQVHGEHPAARALAPADRQVKFLAPPHPGRSGKHDIASSTRRCASGGTGPSRPQPSGAQACPALPAARREDRTAGARSHAQPEPVSLRPTAVVRLKCALAHCYSRYGAARLVTSRLIWSPRACSTPLRRAAAHCAAAEAPSGSRARVVRQSRKRARQYRQIPAWSLYVTARPHVGQTRVAPRRARFPQRDPPRASRLWTTA